MLKFEDCVHASVVGAVRYLEILDDVGVAVRLALVGLQLSRIQVITTCVADQGIVAFSAEDAVVASEAAEKIITLPPRRAFPSAGPEKWYRLRGHTRRFQS